MSVNTLKCVNCNVVISEVLAFIRNKHDIMDNESLIRICESAFSEDEIDKAKNLLFTTVKTVQKCISRRKQKKQKDLEDIISVFKTSDPEQIPLFVAYDLHKLPPICFDHVDVTKLLKDLLVLRAEIMQIKTTYATKCELEDMKVVFKSAETPVQFLNSNNINTKRGGYMLDSGPIGLSHITELTADADVIATRISTNADQSGSDIVLNAPAYRSLFHTEASGGSQSTVIPPALINSTLCSIQGTLSEKHPVGDKSKQRTMAEVVKDGVWKGNEQNAWTLVRTRRTKRNRFTGMTGKAVSSPNGNFKAAESQIPLFISNVNKETTEHDICEYIKTKTHEVVKLEKITMKKERPYNAFKVFVSKYKLDTFLNDNLWPEGIKFRRFIFFKKLVDRGNTQMASEIRTHS